MNTNKYIEEFNLNSKSGGAIMFTRTREPFKCLDALKECAFSKKWSFKVWNVKDGIKTHTLADKPDEEIRGDGNIDITGSFISTVEEMLRDDNSTELEEKKLGTTGTLLTIHAAHHWLGQVPTLTEAIRQYVRELAEYPNKRIVFVVPEGVTLNEELRNDVPVIDLDLPDREDLERALAFIIDSAFSGDSLDTIFTKKEIFTLCGSAAGMTELEAEFAFAKATTLQIDSFRKSNKIDFEAFNKVVLNQKTEIVKQSEVLEMMDAIPMSDVGGLENYKEWIGRAAKCFTDEAKKFGVSRPKGIAAIGPAGTGKSLLAKATASALNMPLVKVDISRIFGSLVGQSEERGRAMIKTLEAMAPCVALVDEIDKALGGAHNSGGDSGVTKRILGIILTAMQESEKPIFWIASANRTEALPSELLRKGRFDEVFGVQPPNAVEREAIFKIHLTKANQDTNSIPNLKLAIEAGKGFVGAELEAAVKESVKVAFVDHKEITGELITEQLRQFKPLKDAFPEDFESMRKWAEDNARPASKAIESVEEKPKKRAARKRTRSIK